VRIPVSDGDIPPIAPCRKGRSTRLSSCAEISAYNGIRDVPPPRQGRLHVDPAELYARQGNVATMTDVQEIISNVAKVPMRR
jgi:hypothetical protein